MHGIDIYKLIIFLLKMETLNIDKVGPGSWYLIHLTAANAKTDKQIEAVHELLKMISNHFFCLRCRDHFKSNMDKFPPPLVNKYNELFIWTVEMHNRVNVLNDKLIVSYRNALDYYVGKSAECNGDCGGGGDKKSSISVLPQSLLHVLTGGDQYKFIQNDSSRTSL